MRGEQQPQRGVPLRRELVQPAAEDWCCPLGQRGETGVGRDDVLVRVVGAEVMRERERVRGRGRFTHSTVAGRIKTLEPRMIVVPVRRGGFKNKMYSNITT